MIAAETASQLVGIFPWADDSDVPGMGIPAKRQSLPAVSRGTGGDYPGGGPAQRESPLLLVRRRQRFVPAQGKQTLWVKCPAGI